MFTDVQSRLVLEKLAKKENSLSAANFIKKRPLVDDNCKLPTTQQGASEPIKKQKLTFEDYKSKKNISSSVINDRHQGENSMLKEQLDGSVEALRSSSLVSELVPLPTVPLSEIIPVGSLHVSSWKSQHVKQPPVSESHHTMTTSSSSDADDQDNILSSIFSSKYTKRILYTGGRKPNENGLFQVPRLADLCSRVLVDCMNDLPIKVASLDSVSPVTLNFDLIKSIVERSNATQLMKFEYHNPRFLAHTDYIWKRICEKEFKSSSTTSTSDEEVSCWREHYTKKLNEREVQFQRARKAVSCRLQANKPKERQTQMAEEMTFSSTTTITSATANAPAFGSRKLTTTCLVDPTSRKCFKSNASSNVAKQPTVAAGKKVMSQGMKATMKLLKKSTRR